MAATFRTPGRRPGPTADTTSHGSPSMIPRAHQHHGRPETPTGIASTSETGTNTSGASDSRKRQSKKDEVSNSTGLGLMQGNSSEVGNRIGKKGLRTS
jgi:hypothetical protein